MAYCCFADKPIGSSDVHAGTLDDVHFEVHAMREPDYTMMMMATYGTLEEKGEMKKLNLEHFIHPWVALKKWLDIRVKLGDFIFCLLLLCLCSPTNSLFLEKPKTSNISPARSQLNVKED